MNSFFRKMRWLLQRREKEAELREELEFHLTEEAEQRREDGLPEQEARWTARRELGNVTLIRENTRAAWGWTIIEQLVQDLRFTLRTMSSNRLFTALAVASLSLGIGANTAIYSFMDAILLRSLPVPDPQSLVVLNWRAKPASRNDFVMRGMSGSTWGDSKSGTISGMFPFPALEVFQKNESFSSVFAFYKTWQSKNLNVTVEGQAGIASAEFVSGDYFRALAVPPADGRLILPDDDRAGAPAVAVISHAFHLRRFGGALPAGGRPILVNNLPFTVVGVTPPEFFGVDPEGAPDLYLPMHANEVLGAAEPFGFRPERYLDPNFYWIQVMGRLRPGVSLAQAQAALAPAFQQWVAGTASNERQRANLPQLLVKGGAGGLDSLRRKYSKPLYFLMLLVGLILALACANVANLLLARASARRREMALRLSVGAGRSRIVRQLLTESVLLASMAGCFGILFAIWGIRLLTAMLANGQANFTVRAAVNWHVLAAAAALSLVTGLLFGLAPALHATRVEVMPALKETRAGQLRTAYSFRGIRLSHTLIVCQISISLLMLFAAGLFVRTLSNLRSVDLGFHHENLLLFKLNARKAGHRDPEIAAFYADLRKRFGAIPGVRSASLSDDSLLQAGFGLPIGLPGAPPSPANRILTVGPGFFTTMQIPILNGRDFEERDHAGSQPVAIINEVFAKANFQGLNPLGEHVTLRKEDRVVRDMEIVGVTRNARYGPLTDAIPPVVYLPYDQGYPEPEQMVYALRTSGDPLLYVASVRETVRQADARVPVFEIRTQADDIDQAMNQEITFTRLCSGFALLALVIACVGLYGAVSYNVARRTGEIGIRMALGARRSAVVRMILNDVLVLAGVGLSIGIAAALSMSKLVESFLFGIKPNDPVAFAIAVITLLGAAVLAGYLPARKASRIDPMIALRHE